MPVRGQSELPRECGLARLCSKILSQRAPPHAQTKQTTRPVPPNLKPMKLTWAVMLLLGCLSPLLLQSQEAWPSVHLHAELFCCLPTAITCFPVRFSVDFSVSQVFVAVLITVCLFNESSFTLDKKLFLCFFLFPFFF